MSAARRWLCLWLPLGAVLLFALAWLSWYGAAIWQLNRMKSEALAAGFPATVAEVIPPEIPEGENAAPALARVQAILKSTKDSEGFIKACPGAGVAECDPLMFDAARLGQLQAQLERPDMREMFRLLREASRKPSARFDRDYSKGAMIELEPLTSMLLGAQFFSSKAWMAARQGNQNDAAADVLACSRLASFGLRDVLLLGWLVGAAVDGVSFNSAQRVLAELPPDSFRMEDWEALDDSWAQHAAEARGDLVRALEAERVGFGAWVFEGVMAGRVSLGETVLQAAPEKSPDAVARWRRTMDVYGTVLAPLFVSDYAAYLRHALSVHDAVKNGSAGTAGGEAFAIRIPKWAILSRLAAPANDRMPARIAEYEVSLQLGRLGLALEDFRSRAGNYPATLQQLDWTDAAITDPFTGQPFVYRPDGDNVLLYSVGIDRADDGGLHAPREKRRDIVWRVQRGESR